MSFYGMFIDAPLCHYYYVNFLTKSFNYPGFKGDAAKLLFDQFVFAPFIIFVFLMYMELTSGKSVDEAVKNSLKKLPSLMIANWKFWPVITLIQLKFFGVHTAALFGIAAGFIWGIYLCLTGSEETPKPEDKKENKEENA